ncbi:MAG: ribose 5-phosphate isomerase B [Candidatus Caenarcaniphilales bacterium]|nr:ribose 5-phosphate isomerase B [Candidatus Caenarcaniphilales bacterium]
MIVCFMHVGIGSDRAGQPLKDFLKENLSFYQLDDFSGSGEEDYPDIAKTLSAALLSGKVDRGILVCGSGIGMSISANRHQGIRAAVLSDLLSARLTRAHNDANVLCLGNWIVAPKMALEIAQVFLSTDFEGGRHLARIEKIEI